MKIRLLVVLILCTVLLAGCGCEHEWKDATCTAPKTCSLCSEVEGEALGHTWADATCEAAKTCTACGVTEGEALGHTWADATCAAPKTCSACGATEGETLEHTFGEWAAIDEENDERICSSCGFAEQQTVDRLAKLKELLGDSKWVCSEIEIEGEIYDASEYADDYKFFSYTYRNDESEDLRHFGKYAGAEFEAGAFELRSYIAEYDTYCFINENYPSYLYTLTGDGEVLCSAYIDESGNFPFVVYYEQEY